MASFKGKKLVIKGLFKFKRGGRQMRVGRWKFLVITGDVEVYYVPEYIDNVLSKLQTIHTRGNNWLPINLFLFQVSFSSSVERFFGCFKIGKSCNFDGKYINWTLKIIFWWLDDLWPRNVKLHARRQLLMF